MNLKLIPPPGTCTCKSATGLSYRTSSVLLTFLLAFLLSGADLVLLLDMTLQQASIYMIRQLFPSVVSFVISILVVGATFSYLI